MKIIYENKFMENSGLLKELSFLSQQLRQTFNKNHQMKSYERNPNQSKSQIEKLYGSESNQRKNKRGSMISKNRFESVTLNLTFKQLNMEKNGNTFIEDNFSEAFILNFLKQSIERFHGKVGGSHLMSCLLMGHASEIQKTVQIQLKQIREDQLHKIISALAFGTISGNNQSFKISIEIVKASVVEDI